MVLVPQVVDAVGVPVVAAGGVAEPGESAVFLGEGVQVKLASCASESNAHELQERDHQGQDRARRSPGPAPGILFAASRTGLPGNSPGLRKRPPEELETRHRPIKGGRGEDVEFGSVMAGQSAALGNRIQPAAEMIRELFEGTQEMFESLHRFSNIDAPGGIPMKYSVVFQAREPRKGWVRTFSTVTPPPGLLLKEPTKLWVLT